MRIIAGCERLWQLRGEGGEVGVEGYGGACREDIDDEEVKYRMDKYENNNNNVRS